MWPGHRASGYGRGAAGGGTTQFTLKAYRSVFLGRDIEDGDKIVLHHSVLEKLMARFGNAQLPHPIIFQIRNVVFDKISHCGVLEFSADEKAAYLPQWMMDNLLLEDGSQVQLKLKTIPKATKIKLQPTQYRFTQMANPKATLEFALRKFTALTQGDQIHIRNGEEKYDLLVQEVAPHPAGKPGPPAVSVVNTSVEVEFAEPVEKAPKQEEAARELDLREVVTGEVGADGYKYYRFKLVDEHSAVNIKVEPVDGDPDLYVSTSHNQPTFIKHTWAAQRHGTNSLTIDPADPNFSKRWYYVGVHGYKAPSTFKICVTEAVPADAAQEDDSSAMAGCEGLKLERLGSNEPDAKQCDNCTAWIPKKAYMMHTLRCARNNWHCKLCNKIMRRSEQASHSHCPVCNAVVPKEELAKHMDLAHRNVKCELCGKSMPPGELEAHKANECELRKVPCRYCKVPTPFARLKEHEAYCSSKSVVCDICGKMISRKKLVNHKAIEHGINPSLASNPNMGPPKGFTPAKQSKGRPVEDVDYSHLLGPGESAAAQPRRDSSLQDIIAQSRQEAEDLALQRALAESAGQVAFSSHSIGGMDASMADDDPALIAALAESAEQSALGRAAPRVEDDENDPALIAALAESQRMADSAKSASLEDMADDNPYELEAFDDNWEDEGNGDNGDLNWDDAGDDDDDGWG